MNYEKKEAISWRGINYEVNRELNGNIILVPILSKLDKKMKWVNRILERTPSSVRFIFNSYETLALDTRNHRWARAICTKEDIKNYNEKIGKALALAKLTNQTIPEIFYE